MYVTSNTSRMAKISASKIFAVYPIVTDTCSLCKMIINVPISAKFLSKIQAHMGLSTSKQQSSTVLHNFLSSNSWWFFPNFTLPDRAAMKAGVASSSASCNFLLMPLLLSTISRIVLTSGLNLEGPSAGCGGPIFSEKSQEYRTLSTVVPCSL